MKLKIIILLVFTIIQSCKKNKIILQPKNELEKFSKVKEQIFDLDTLSFSEIKGKNGTLLYFNKNDFNVQKKSKVKVILKEYFEFSELIYNNINTITDKNELLESSGVIYLEFQSDGKKITLKKNKFIEIKLPKKQIKESQLFYAKVDSLKPIKWEKDNTKYKRIIRVLNFDELRLKREYIIPSDSLSFYNEKWKKEDENWKKENEKLWKENEKLWKENEKWLDSQYKINKTNNYALRLLSDKYNSMSLINFDTFIKSGVKLIDFQIESNNKSVEQLSFYIIYKNRKSFVSLYKTTDNLNFNKIPFIEKETSLLVIGNNSGNLLFDIIEIKENSSKKLEFNLKKYDKTQIKNLLKR